VAGIAIDALRAYENPQPIAVDLGTGSGAIALAMAHEVPNARVFGVEVAPLAFAYTKQNFVRLPRSTRPRSSSTSRSRCLSSTAPSLL